MKKARKNIAKPKPVPNVARWVPSQDQRLHIAIIVRESKLALLDNLLTYFTNEIAEIKKVI